MSPGPALTARLLETADGPRAFLMELVYGVVRWRRFLDWAVSRAARQAPPPDLQAFLQVGLYQILKLDTVPPYAAVNETVAAVKAALGERQARFANAVLRRTLRERASLAADLARQPLGIRQSHPDELLARWVRHFKEGPTEALCAWNNRRAEVRLCANTLTIADDRLPLDLAGRGVAEPGGWVLAAGERIADLPGYREGHFLVMDPAARRAVDLLAPRPGERILDACAAPGGKTALMAARLKLTGRLVALERSETRRPRLLANLERLGCGSFVEVAAGDARQLSPAQWGEFDGILLDVPCSNTGVIRRKPDVRWRFSAQALKRLAADQRRLLDGVACLLKPDGRLVYSTCSLEPEENERLVAAWLAAHPEFRLEGERRVFPPADNADGAYAACLRRLPDDCRMDRKVVNNLLPRPPRKRQNSARQGGAAAEGEANG